MCICKYFPPPLKFSSCLWKRLNLSSSWEIYKANFFQRLPFSFPFSLVFFAFLLQPPITITPFCENAEKFFSRFSFIVAISTHNSLLHSSASQLSSSVMDFFLINGNVYPIMNGPQTFLLFSSPLFFINSKSKTKIENWKKKVS